MLIALVAMAGGGLALGIVGRLARRGGLKPNRWAGIRTPYTHSSEEAWYATHRHGGPILERAGFSVAVASAVSLVLGLTGAIDVSTQAIMAFALAAVVLAAAVASWLVGTSRARQELAGRDPKTLRTG